MQQYKTQLVYPGNVRMEDPSSGAILDPLVRWGNQTLRKPVVLIRPPSFIRQNPRGVE
jgi:hypothetical protein